jgi:hypothetical protein
MLRGMSGAELQFEGPVVEWRGPPPYFFVRVPDEEGEDVKLAAKGLEYWGQVPVVAQIHGVEFRTAMWNKDGRYLLPVRADVRREAGVELDDVVAVALWIGGR